jgi:hypothetical protein
MRSRPRAMQTATLRGFANNLSREPLECYLAQPVRLITSYVPSMRRRRTILCAILVVALCAAGVAWPAFHRGPRESELRTFVLSSTEGATGIEVVRNDMDDTGTIWLRVQMSDGASKERGYEFVERWVWPWQSYFDVDPRSAGT